MPTLVAALPFFTDALFNVDYFLHARTYERKNATLEEKRGGGFVGGKNEEEAEIDTSEYCALKCAALAAGLPRLTCVSLMAACPRAGQDPLCGEQERR